MTSLRILRAAACAALAFVTAAAIAPPKHMLFRARGPNGALVYFVGSVHLLSPESGTLPPEIDSAFAHSKTIVFETNLDSARLKAPEMLARASYPEGTTLRLSMSPAGVTALDSILHLYGLSFDQVNHYRPWFVAVAMSQVVMQRANFQPQYGVDAQLDARAHSANKRIMGLEPAQVQISLLDSIPPADQERMVLEIGGPESAAKELILMKEAWLAGDVARLDSMINAGMPPSSRMYEMLITRRNLSWMPAIEMLLKGKDDALVVVGAAHLTGKQGLLELLRAKGYRIDQL